MEVSTTPKRRTAIYIRVSTPEQKVEGYGLEAQKRRLQEYIANNSALNLEEVAFFEDTHTGSDLNREDFKKMMQQVEEKKFDAILVWKIDRLSRSLKHLLSTFEVMKENGVSFISVQENIDFRGAIGGLIFQIFGAIAQFERELIKGRTKSGRIASAEMGNYTGSNIPYGYEPIKNKSGKGKTLKVIPEERKWVEKMFHWYIYDGLGDLAIAKKLNELNVSRGKHAKGNARKWTARHIEHIIPNTIYRGEYVANQKDDEGNTLAQEEWTITQIPQCVTEFVFAQANYIRSNRTNGVGEKSDKYLLTGKVKDVTLPNRPAFSGKNRTDGKRSYYRKQNPAKGIKVFEVPADELEDYVWSKIVKAMNDPEAFIKEWAKRGHTSPSQIKELENELEQLRTNKINLELKIERIESFGASGSWSEEKMNKHLREAEKELIKTEEKIEHIEKELQVLGNIEIELKQLKNTSKQFKHRIDKITRAQKKTIVQLFVKEVRINRVPLPDHLQTGKRVKYHRTVTVTFRFNPERFSFLKQKDRTTKTANTNKKTSSTSENVLGGGAR